MLQLVQMHLLTLAILIAITFSMVRTKGKRFFLNRIFYLLIISNLLIVVFDMIHILSDGKTDSLSRILLPIFTFLYYSFHLVVITTWIFYVDYTIYQDKARFKKLAILTLPIVIIGAIISFLGMFGNYFFYIDEFNNYFRGQYFYGIVGISYFLMFAALFHLINQRHRVKKADLYGLVIFPFPPLIAALVQIIDGNVTLIWSFTAISVLIIYISIQSKITTTDALTGLYNRVEYEYLIDQKYKTINPNRQVGAIVIDIDDLKKINDQYLHHAGDMALIKLSEILKASVRKDDFIARIGGDEFIIITDSLDQDALTKIIKRIRENLIQFNHEQTQKYHLQISIGYGIYNAKQHQSFQDFLNVLDKKMYQEKLENKINTL
jgi:diguanylate cyclase (GGDEF)-like protein